jgi:hypothetical protein
MTMPCEQEDNEPSKFKRYFPDRFDADGKFYVFDEQDGGAECAGPFDTLDEAIAVANAMGQE